VNWRSRHETFRRNSRFDQLEDKPKSINSDEDDDDEIITKVKHEHELDQNFEEGEDDEDDLEAVDNWEHYEEDW